MVVEEEVEEEAWSVWSRACASVVAVGLGEWWSVLVVGVWSYLVVFVTVWETIDVLCKPSICSWLVCGGVFIAKCG